MGIALLRAVFVAALLVSGCATTPDPAKTDSALRARLKAADLMSGPNRNLALDAVAIAASEANNVEVAKDAISKRDTGSAIAFVSGHPGYDCAKHFLKHQNFEAATEIAATMPTGVNRDEILRAIAENWTSDHLHHEAPPEQKKRALSSEKR